jgi:dTDP-4-dehydrorhamnose reductase
MARILVTGASGLLGINFSLQAINEGHEVIGTINQHNLKDAPFQTISADLAGEGVVETIINEIQPDIILHTAAMAIIDACEKQPDVSRRVNAELPGKIAKISQKSNIRLVHISTDAVFDGITGGYVEDDTPNPLSMYASHKLDGERAVLDNNPDAIVARVNFFGWSLAGTRSLSEWFFNNLSNGTPVKGFRDVYFCPLLVNDLAQTLLKMVNRRLSGVYHVLAPSALSKYEFGVLIAREFDLDERLITPTSWKDGGLQAARSPNLILKVDKLIHDLGIVPPDPAEGVGRFASLWQDGYASRVRQMSQPA